MSLSLRLAILKTISYADVFDYPLTLTEIRQYLIGKKISIISLERLTNCLLKDGLIETSGGYFFLAGRGKIVAARIKKGIYSRSKWLFVNEKIRWLKRLPFIKLIGVTGNLAVDNADDEDDIDLVVIACAKRLWLVRLFLVVALELFGVRRRPLAKNFVGNKLCLNLFLDESELAVPKNKMNLFVSHEVCQMRPVFIDGNTYTRFLLANNWAKNFLPNAVNWTHLVSSGKFGNREKHLLNFMNRLACSLQLEYMRKHITTELIEKNYAYFHPNDFEQWVMLEYKKRLRTIV